MQDYHPTYCIILEAASHDELATYLRRYYRDCVLWRTATGFDAILDHGGAICRFDFTLP